MYASSNPPGSEVNTRQRARSLFIHVAAAAFALVAGGVIGTHDAGRARAVTADMMMMLPQEIVVLEERQVCSLLGPPDAGIVGQDGGQSISVDGTSYWTFGDTMLRESPSWIANGIATTSDTDGTDCVSLTHKNVDGVAVPLLPLGGAPEEALVWPGAMVAAQPGFVNFFYASVARTPAPFKVRFLGQARFDTATLTAERLGADPQGTSFWPLEYGIGAVSTIVDGGFAYAFLGSGDGWLTEVRLARVPLGQVEDVSAYRYWHADVQQFNDQFSGASVLFSEMLALLPSQVSWNALLSKWTMLYYSMAQQRILVRTADALAGPWGEPSSMFDCRIYYPGPGPLGTYCYSAIQHEELQQGNGATIFVTVANEKDYRLFLHEVTLGEQVHQVLGADGQRSYVLAGVPLPEGSQDEGIAFFAGRRGDATLAPVRRWSSGGEVVFAATQPAPAGYQDDGVAFYAPFEAMVEYAPLSPGVQPSTRVVYEPVYRWDRADTGGGPPSHVYSQFASVPGYVQGPIAFYAPCPDTDLDGANDCAESRMGTDRTKVDTDGDRCGDAKEPPIGLDPGDPWDFYSVPIPALYAAPDPNRALADGKVGAVDAQAVFAYFKAGAAEGMSVYDQDLDGNGVPDGRQYDRSVVGPGRPGAADGAVTARDAQLAFAQAKRFLRC